ncbi:MAG: hypothetical protein JOZ80_10615 [Acidobacteriaceae bacterium]|nr:hypothetical protein [Acidobacteriaceae bacterium]
MRSVKVVAVLAMCVVVASLIAVAKENQFGVADSRILQITAPTRVGDVVLPEGTYKVLHTMESQNHIMVFKQLNTRKPAEARIKCQLQPLTEKAPRDEQTFLINAANERVLHTLVFKGDSAQHVF